MNVAIIIAGGSGQRMGANIPKQFINVYDKPVLLYTLEGFEKPEFLENFEAMLKEHGIESLYLFCTFPTLMGLVRHDRWDMLQDALLNEGAWKRMLREGATTTFEGWGKETKWNTSLFHLTIAYAAAFMADVDIKHILT